MLQLLGKQATEKKLLTGQQSTVDWLRPQKTTRHVECPAVSDEHQRTIDSVLVNQNNWVIKQLFQCYLGNSQTIVPRQWRNLGNCSFRLSASGNRFSDLLHYRGKIIWPFPA